MLLMVRVEDDIVRVGFPVVLRVEGLADVVQAVELVEDVQAREVASFVGAVELGGGVVEFLGFVCGEVDVGRLFERGPGGVDCCGGWAGVDCAFVGGVVGGAPPFVEVGCVFSEGKVEGGGGVGGLGAVPGCELECEEKEDGGVCCE